jgi:hypothetical protein
VQYDEARVTVDELGHLGCLQFNDLNPSVSAFMRHFANDVKRAEELERRLRYLETQLALKGVRLNGADLLTNSIEMQVKKNIFCSFCFSFVFFFIFFDAGHVVDGAVGELFGRGRSNGQRSDGVV